MMRLALALALAPSAVGTVSIAPLHASRLAVVFGESVVLSGKFKHGFSHVPVMLLAKESGDRAYALTGLLETTSGGHWSTSVQPTIGTSYEATSLSERTRRLAIGVHPRVTLVRRGTRFVARVVSAVSYEHRFVLLQRRKVHAWLTVGRVVLSNQPKRFDFRLPRGVSRIRIFLPRSQAGAGYLSSFSSTVVVRR